MDRNENRNSYRNTNYTRGVNQKVKVYRSKMIAAIVVAAVLLAAVIVLTVGYVSLHSKYTEAKAGKQEETTADTVIDTNQTDEANAEEGAETAAETTANLSAAETPDTAAETTAETAEAEIGTEAGEQAAETVEAGSENTSDAAEAESGTASDVQNADETAQFADAEAIRKAMDEAVKDYAGLNYWLVPATGAEVIMNADKSAAETALGETAPELGKIFVLGKLYDRLNNSAKNPALEEGITDPPVQNEQNAELNSELRILAAVMLGELESYEKIAEGTNAAADKLIAKIGEYSVAKESKDSEEGEKEDGETAKVAVDFTAGLKKINAFCKDVLGCEGVEIKGFDVKDGVTPVNTFALADCLTFFDRLQEDGFNLDAGRLENMTNRLKWNTEDEFVKATQEASGGAECEVLYAGKEGSYEIYSVNMGSKAYVVAVNGPADTAADWKMVLAKAAADAVPETAETQANVVIAEADNQEVSVENQEHDEIAGSEAETQPVTAEKKTDAAPENGAIKSGITANDEQN